MPKIMLNESLQCGIKGVTKSKPKVKKKYQELVSDANRKINEERSYYASAYKNASNCLAR